MPSGPLVRTWKGRILSELTREELIEALTRALGMLELERRVAQENAEMEKLFQDVGETVAKRCH